VRRRRPGLGRVFEPLRVGVARLLVPRVPQPREEVPLRGSSPSAEVTQADAQEL
jgi:hypothetical protein